MAHRMLSLKNDTIRIERGPRVLEAEATKELLSDAVTRSHYQPPRKATPEELASDHVLTEGDQRLFLDAKGKPIRLGEMMTYADWLEDENSWPFKVYQWTEVNEKDGPSHRFLQVAEFDDEAEAIAAASEL